MTEPSERPGPVARLLGSLANVLIDLGLPTIRQWLRDRLGPGADVAQVTTDGSLIHLDDVDVPVGPGWLRLSRASLTGLPEVYLHAFEGALTLGEGLRVELAFAAAAAAEREDGAWIDGEVVFRLAMAGSATAWSGRARLFASSCEWRLDAGVLESDAGRVHFAAAGVFEGVSGSTSPPAASAPPVPLVPRAISSAAVSIQRAKLGALLELAGAVRGRPIRVPLPVAGAGADLGSAELEGDVAWSLEAPPSAAAGPGVGGRWELGLAGPGFRARCAGTTDLDGSRLDARASARIELVPLLRSLAAPAEAMPRDDDAVQLELTVGGSVTAPEAKGTIRASELGFRLGRPRFVPAILVRDLAADLRVAGRRLVVEGAATAKDRRLSLDADADLGAESIRSSARAGLRTEVDAGLVRDVLRTLGVHLEVPDDIVIAADVALLPKLGGSVTAATGRSRVVGDRSPAGAARLRGRIAVADALATGLFRGSIRPAHGDVAIDLALALGRGADGVVARGTASATALGLAIHKTERVEDALELEDVSANVTIDRERFAYDEVRFCGHGGRFLAEGTIPFGGRANPSSPLFLRLEDGNATLAATLLTLFAPSAAKLPLRLPADLGGRGTLDLQAGGALGIDVVLESGAGTTLGVAFALGPPGRRTLDGSRLKGAIAIADLRASGALGEESPLAPDGIVVLDLAARGAVALGDAVVTGWLSAARVAFAWPGETRLGLTELSARLRADAHGLAWNGVDGALAGGRVASVGTVRWNGALRAQLAVTDALVQDLGPFGGRAPGRFVHGRLSATLQGRWEPGRHPRATGHARLDEATVPAIDLARPTLVRYGLRPPNEDATAPVTATITSTEWGITAGDAAIDLHGARVRGSLGISWAGALDGKAEVTLEEDYLRTSKVLTLPRVFTERLVLPIRLEGTLATPHVHGNLGSSLGSFLKDNRVTTFVSSAVEEAQILLGQHPRARQTPAPLRPSAPPPDEGSLHAEIESYAADWSEIEERVRRG